MTSEAKVIDAAIKLAVERGGHSGFAGNCARFAIVLNRALGGGGIYVVADSGEHYEYVDHVALRYRGQLYDGTGALTARQLRTWGSKLEDIGGDADADAALRLVDEGCLGDFLDEEALERDLREALAACRARAKGRVRR